MLTIEEIYNKCWEHEQTMIPRLNVSNYKGIETTFWLNNQKYAIYEISKSNWIQAKQHFYLCGRLDELAIVKYNSNLFQYGFRHVCYALLSDCKELIERYIELRYTGDGKNYPDFEVAVEKGESDIFCHTMLVAAKGDWEMLARNIGIMEDKTFKLKKNQGVLELDLAFFKALYSKDKEAIEKSILSMLEPKNHKKRNDDPVYAQYFSTPAASYAKLAWMNGIEVVIDNVLAPQELLPIQPLSSYDDTYEFFKW